MNDKRRLLLVLIPVALSLLATIILLPSLPEQVPTHWGADGQVDTYKPRLVLLFTALLPGLFVGLFFILPQIDPRGENFKKHRRAYLVTSVMTVLFIIAMHWVTILASLGIIVEIGIIVRVMMAVLFGFIGNYLPQVKSNYTYGIRTPWTLDEPEVWKRTHRYAGKAFFVASALILLSIFLPPKPGFFLTTGTTVLLVFSLYLYSFIIYRKRGR